MPPSEHPKQKSPRDSNTPPPSPREEWRRWLWPGLLAVFLLIVVIVGTGWNSRLNVDNTAIEVPYSLVRNNAGQNLKQIDIASDGLSAKGEFRTPVVYTKEGETTEQSVTRFRTNLPLYTGVVLEDILREQNPQALVKASAPESGSLLVLLFQYVPLLLMVGLLFWLVRRAQGQMTGVFGFGKSQAREYDMERPQVTFVDIAGQDAAKGELIEIVDFLRNPDKYISLGARVPRGVLLVGPPGTGKTLMARAVAGEANCSFYSIAASEFVEMFVGVGASRVRDLFNRAKENAPSIVFIDEIDAVGRQRGAGLGGGNDEREQTLNQMLSELDGFEQTATVIVMAATNRPDVLDPALLRPGRFDRQVTVDLPDRKGRFEILQIHTRGKPVDPSVELENIARATIGFSGADLANLANEAALTAARKNRKKILTEDFSQAFERIILGTERPPLSNQEERRVVAYHEAGHAVVAMLTPGADRVLKVTITPRGQALGITAFMPEDDRRNYSRRYIEATMAVALGGRIAEEIVIHDITTGASNDLRRVTDLARRMVAQFGMSQEIGPLNFGENESQPFLGHSLSQPRSYSEETAARIDVEVRKIIEAIYKRTKEQVVNNKHKLDALAEALLEREVLERDEVLQIMGFYDEKPLDVPEEQPSPGGDLGLFTGATTAPDASSD
jgi:cell division protease FtsH